jgi:hypothetical protein
VPPQEHVPSPIGVAARDEDSARASSSRNALFTAAAIALVAVLIWTGRDPSPAADRSVAAPTAGNSQGVKGAIGTTGNAASSATDEPVTVALRVDRVCWVDAAADGKRAIYRLMQPGEKATISARERLVLRVGDAGALTISVDGGAPQAAGANGEVRTLTFEGR